MCGIVGTYLENDRAAVETMLNKVMHRGPDGSGILETACGIIGHSRLAIMDPERGQQPLAIGDSSITYNGEIYNFRALAQKWLPDCPLGTHADTEVVLRMFLAMGPECTKLFDGMFAFAILHEGHIFAARDPLGIKPLYYGEADGAFHFASEIKALAAICTTIQEFPAGYWFDSRMGWHCFFNLDERIKIFHGTRPDAVIGIRKVVNESVRKRLMSDVPVGVCLSGGLDSSVVSYCARQYLLDVNSFAVGMEGSEDLAAARQVAVFLGTRHHERIYSEHDMLDVLPQVVQSLESFDPALVRSAFPNWFLAELASSEVKVVLTGEGADELFAGYDYLGVLQEKRNLQSEMMAMTKNLCHTNLQRADRLSMAFGLEARVPFLDVESVAYALGLPVQWKMHRGRLPKQLLRDAYEGLLPANIINRPKLKFSQGAGSSSIFWTIAEEQVSESDFRRETKRMLRDWGYELANKEALFYYRMLHEVLADTLIFPLMHKSRSL